MSSTSQTRSLNLDRVLDEQVDWRYKSFPAGPPTPIRGVRKRGWNVLGGEFMLPAMVLKESALRHNSRLMASYCKRHDILLAPHGKTTMAPQLLKMQLDDGAWAVTAATMSQVRVWRAFGVDRVILANELVEPASVRWVASEMNSDPDFEFYCLVDSVAEVSLLESALADTGLGRRLKVLLEFGPVGGRTGCRTHEQALEVAQAIAGSEHLALAGVEAFEGVISVDSLAGTIVAIDRFLHDMRALVAELDGAGFFAQVPGLIVTAGGSAFPDRVVAHLGGPWELSRPVRLVLRSGCYITHDAVHYNHLSPFGGRIPETEPLVEALEVWGVVLSLPEPGLAILGFGKRDVSHDLELPVPRFVKTGGPQPPRPLRAEASIFALNDQHAFMKVGADADLKVGDIVGCGISHPCTAFDKWRLIPVVDDGYRVVDAVLTYF
ncbi:MAG: amino acid deaminase [Candidatus Dormibacteraeota bacterium]|nr:amino acid deaminase [Candidatus Dormibacteraeota bacterium]